MPKTSLVVMASFGLIGVATAWFIEPISENPELASEASGELLGPDLALTWASPIEDLPEGTILLAGSRIPVAVKVENLGVEPALGTLRLLTPLGPHGDALSLDALPSGKSMTVELPLAIAVGMREVCVVVELRSPALEAPPDANPANNRICRRHHVDAPYDP